MARIAVIGSGTVGRATGKGFAKAGHSVTFIDVNPAILEQLRKEGYPATDISRIDELDHEISILCLPTPLADGEIYLGFYEEVLPYLGKKLSMSAGYHLVVIRSTVPPNTCERLIIPKLEELSKKRAGRDFGVCMNPEFLREEKSESDFLHPWSIVIGSLDKKSEDALVEIYSYFMNEATPALVRTDLKTAEMTKYAQNLYNAAKISFANEIWGVCQRLGINGDTVMAAVTQSAEGMWNPRYGTKGGYPYAGKCLVKDTRGFLAYAQRELNVSMPLLEATITVNDSLESKTGRDSK